MPTFSRPANASFDLRTRLSEGQRLLRSIASTPLTATIALLVMASVAIGFGVLTVMIADAFPTRPIFFLALPLIVMIVSAAFLDLRALLMSLVLLRAILDPVFQQATLPGIGGLGGLLNLSLIVIALALFVFQEGKQYPRKSYWPWLAFIAITGVGLFRAADLVFALRWWLSLLTHAAVYFLAFYCLRKVDELDRIFRWLLLSAIPVCIYSVVSYALFGPSSVVEVGEATSGRLSEPLGHPNILGFYLVVVMAVWLAKEKTRPGAPLFNLRGIAWLVYLIGILGVIAGTQTRSAWAGALFLMLIYGVAVKRVYLLLIAIGAVLAMMVPDIRDRVLDLFSNNEVFTYSRLNSYAWRQYLWTSALSSMSVFSLIVGDGLAAFWAHSMSFFPLAGGHAWEAHSVYVQLIYETGVIGLLSYVVVLGAAFAIVWQQKAVRKEVRMAALALIACFAFMSYSDNMLDYLVVNWNCWFVVGLVVAAGAKTQSARRENAP